MLTACLWHSGRSSPSGAFWLICHLSQGCCGQAGCLAVEEESKQERAKRAGVQSPQNWRRRRHLSFRPCKFCSRVQWSQTSKTSYFWCLNFLVFFLLTGKGFYVRIYGVLMAFDTVTHFCSSPMVSITPYWSATSFPFKCLLSSLHLLNSPLLPKLNWRTY